VGWTPGSLVCNRESVDMEVVDVSPGDAQPGDQRHWNPRASGIRGASVNVLVFCGRR